MSDPALIDADVVHQLLRDCFDRLGRLEDELKEAKDLAESYRSLYHAEKKKFDDTTHANVVSSIKAPWANVRSASAGKIPIGTVLECTDDGMVTIAPFPDGSYRVTSNE